MTLKLNIEMNDNLKTQKPGTGFFSIIGIVRIYLETDTGVRFTLHSDKILRFNVSGNYFLNRFPWVESAETLEGLFSNIRDKFLVVENENKLYVPKRASRHVIKTLAEMCDFDVTHLADIVMIKIL